MVQDSHRFTIFGLADELAALAADRQEQLTDRLEPHHALALLAVQGSS